MLYWRLRDSETKPPDHVQLTVNMIIFSYTDFSKKLFEIPTLTL